MYGGSEIVWGKERIRLWNAWNELNSLFSRYDFATTFHFQIQFSSIFGLYSQAEATSMTTKTKTKILRR